MAMLYFENLGVQRPDMLMSSARHSLNMFYQFLDQAKSYLLSDKAVQRLSWTKAVDVNDVLSQDKQIGFWIELSDPEGEALVAQSTYDVFLDEKTIYEADTLDKVERFHFNKENALKVLERDSKNNLLCLEREPRSRILLVRPNTYALKCQMDAVKHLMNTPAQAHRPLLRLFEPERLAVWPRPYTTSIEEWMVLTDTSRNGTSEQRGFVGVALNTPDFAFLEGPPGSGKTTAICELILQLMKQNKRVLLCASTHVAVDNVLERLMDENNPERDRIIPIRIGEADNLSDTVKPFQLSTFLRTEKERLLKGLNRIVSKSSAQQELLSALRSGDETVQRIVLESANLICGTTIGILQHPDIKQSRTPTSPIYDVLIIDEASKTTFQEFLVPALLAKRWILVGDPKQLSPYVDEDALAVNLQACLKEEHWRNACVDVFLAKQSAQKRQITLISDANDRTIQAYQEQSIARNVTLRNANDSNQGLWDADLVIGSQTDLSDRASDLPLDISVVRGNIDEQGSVARQIKAFNTLTHKKQDKPDEWEDEVAWRLARSYEQRLNVPFAQEEQQKRKSTTERLKSELNQLLPIHNPEEVQAAIDRVRRIALPSILEALQKGFERNPLQRDGTALTDGLPQNVLANRHVLLSYQHRMHPDIANFPHEFIYHKEALHCTDDMGEKRHWSYTRYSHRSVWLKVSPKKFDPKSNSNSAEADSVIDELREFERWAKSNRPSVSNHWEVAVLTFYRGQEREIRKKLRQWTKQQGAVRNFIFGEKNQPHLKIQLCTVDRFQGQEADLVLLSFAKDHATSFLESPNRLNVALTRARFQLVIIGHREAMKKSSGVLGQLAESTPWHSKIKDQV